MGQYRTFRATFEMLVDSINYSLIKIDKQQYRNPMYLAREWQKALDEGNYPSYAALARHLKLSRARVTQILNLLKLSPEVINMVVSLGDPLKSTCVSERRLRPLLRLNAEKQAKHIKTFLSGISQRY